MIKLTHTNGQTITFTEMACDNWREVHTDPTGKTLLTTTFKKNSYWSKVCTTTAYR